MIPFKNLHVQNTRRKSKEGDWICLNCSNYNFSFRKICNRCNQRTKKINDDEILKIGKQNYGDYSFPSALLLKIGEEFPKQTQEQQFENISNKRIQFSKVTDSVADNQNIVEMIWIQNLIDEIQQSLKMQRRKICRYFERGSCKKDNCPFVHILSSRKQCQFFMQGYCKKGDKCEFYHAQVKNEKKQKKQGNYYKKVQKQVYSLEDQEQGSSETEEYLEKEEHNEQNQNQPKKIEQSQNIQQIKLQKKILCQKIQEQEISQSYGNNKFLAGLQSNIESDDSDQELEDKNINEKIQFTEIYPKKFPDFSKTAQNKQFVIQNEEKYFKKYKFLELINKIQDPYEKQYYQIIRKFQDSFKILNQQQPKIFIINIRPLLFEKQINLHFDMIQDTLQFKINCVKYPAESANIQIINVSIPKAYTDKINVIINQYHKNHSLFTTLKYLQNNFEQIYGQSKFRLQNQFYSQKQIKKKLQKLNLEIKYQSKNQIISKKLKKIKSKENSNPDIIEIKCDKVPGNNLNYEIKVDSLMIQNCQYVMVSSLLLYFECICQKQLVYILRDENQKNLLIGMNVKCKKCSSIIIISFERQVMQLRSLELGKLGIQNARLLQLGGLSWKIGCLCDQEITKNRLLLPGQRITSNCHQCFQHMTVSFMGIKWFNPFLKQQQIVLDKQLPNKGTCKNNKLSFRWFRYGCCGRIFCCDECHNQGSAHLHNKINGNTMVCGFCSHEQNIQNECSFCKKQLKKGIDKSGHWQGGMGCRDQTLLSKKDAKKYTGITKKK